MFVKWRKHSRERFAQRMAQFGINYGDIEFEIKRQEVKFFLGGKKFKTIFKIGNLFITAIKVESPEMIFVLTLWESSEKEVFEWNKMIVQFADQNRS